jgi:hypothetical protein
MTSVEHRANTPVGTDLPLYRLHLMRAGYLMLGLGLAVVKWPLLVGHDSSEPVMDGVVTCLLTALSLLAFLGLRYPVRLLPILVFESAWKLIWLSVVALPELAAGDMDPATREVMASCLWVVVVLAVVPWRYVWQQYVAAPGDRWRRAHRWPPRGAWTSRGPPAVVSRLASSGASTAASAPWTAPSPGARCAWP